MLHFYRLNKTAFILYNIYVISSLIWCFHPYKYCFKFHHHLIAHDWLYLSLTFLLLLLLFFMLEILQHWHLNSAYCIYNLLVVSFFVKSFKGCMRWIGQWSLVFFDLSITVCITSSFPLFRSSRILMFHFRFSFSSTLIKTTSPINVPMSFVPCFRLWYFLS